MAQITATYKTTDTYDIDFDLSKVFYWDIKYGVLTIIENEGDEEIEIEATASGTDDPCFKRPETILVDNDDGQLLLWDGLGNPISK